MDYAHLFALYDASIDHYSTYVNIKDFAMVHRVVKVLRLKKGELFILFNKKRHLHVELIEVARQSIVIRVLSKHQNTVLSPSITMILPLLKKNALEEALYNTVEAGVTTIQLVTTTKSRQSITDLEMSRLHKITIAASEQSKQFVVPDINKPMMVSRFLDSYTCSAIKLFADPTGTSLLSILNSVRSNANIMLMVGPEGDLTQFEKDALKEKGFYFCMMTPTILRSLQAASIMTAVSRMYYSKHY